MPSSSSSSPRRRRPPSCSRREQRCTPLAKPFFSTAPATETALNDTLSGESAPASAQQINDYFAKASLDLAFDLATDGLLGKFFGKEAAESALGQVVSLGIGYDAKTIAQLGPSLQEVEDAVATVGADVLGSQFAAGSGGTAAQAPVSPRRSPRRAKPLRRRRASA